ncbi:hypothetical protein MmiEs2_11190 [Methanimicrococcus stummii]|uniref:Zinc-ribbon domain-containing protein n=1 Tax=Methanimicrococcus stummii TaxID=3028294 RepID=A0AA96VIF8_9EURY|nr:zinc ribbon domain-containing protein [Methanimicrococcus sp. Es2]WNY28906.1 hypothetical protein MmiEs2_11190 [Methanimicrococcus sp. Es2]
MANNFCSNCGEPLKEYAIVCSSCGTPVKGRENQDGTDQSYQSQQSQYTNESANAEHVCGEEIPRYVPVKEKSTFFAAILSFFMAGLGQVYNGKFGRGLCFMVGAFVGSFLIVPGIAVWIWSIYDAYTEADKINKGELPFKEATVWEIIGFLLLPFIVFVIFVLFVLLIFIGIAVPFSMMA